MNRYDYIVVGSGIGGLYTALMAREHGSVLVITKGSIDDCNTKYAQGGIAAAISKNDSPELHLRDTMNAGDGLSDEATVRILVSEAPARIADLVGYRVPFDTLDGEIALTMEAAHSVPRVLHAGGDATGEHIEVTLSQQVRASGIQVLENFLATEILVEKDKVAGIKALECRTGTIENFECRYLILATGGSGQLFKYNTNSDIATGDGIALAYTAGHCSPHARRHPVFNIGSRTWRGRHPAECRLPPFHGGLSRERGHGTPGCRCPQHRERDEKFRLGQGVSRYHPSPSPHYYHAFSAYLPFLP
jgi:L-aspartate oxidase